MYDINGLTPIVTMCVGIALGYGFRGLIAREERQELVKLQGYYDDLTARIKSIASKGIAQVEKAL